MGNLRSFLPIGGSFVSIPEEFKTADSGVKYAPKIEVQVHKNSDNNHPYGFDYVINPHNLLFDLEAIDITEFDPKKVIKDCELLIAACEKSPEKVRSILEAFAENAPREKIIAARKIAEELCISESEAIKAGGGMMWLAVLVAAAILLHARSAW